MCRAIITQCDCDRCRGGQHFGKLYGIDYCPPHRAPMADIRTSSSVGQPLGAFCGPSSFAPCKDVKWVAWADPAACHFKSENKVKDGDNKTTQPPPLNPSFLRSIDPLLLGLEPSGPLSADNLAKADDAATPAAMAAPVPAAASSAAPLVAATAAQAQANKNSNGNLPWPTAGLTDVNPPLYPSTPSSLPMIDNLPTSAQPGSATTQSPPQQTKARNPRCRNHVRCPLCGKGHRDDRSLIRHLWVQHPAYAQQNNTPSEKKRCTYPGCEYQGRADNVARHMRQHEE